MSRENNPFGQLIRETRRRNGISQGELSKQTDIHQATLSAWETGRQTPYKTNKKHLSSLSKALGIPIRELNQTLAEQCSTKEKRTGLCLEEFLTEQSNFIRNKCQEGLDLWIFDIAPEGYYGKSNIIIYNNKNLPEQDIHYHVPIPLDRIKSEVPIYRLGQIASYMKDLSENPSKITLYPFYMKSKKEEDKNSVEEYYKRTFLSERKDLQAEDFCKAHSVTDINIFVLEDLESFFSINQAFMLYVPNKHSLSATSCINLRNVFSSPYSTEKLSNWYFLDRDTTGRLGFASMAIKSHFDE